MSSRRGLHLITLVVPEETEEPPPAGLLPNVLLCLTESGANEIRAELFRLRYVSRGAVEAQKDFLR
jgi:hypothetical protein